MTYMLFYALGSAAMGVRGILEAWVLGDRFSAADIYLFMLTTWLAPARGQPSVDEFPNVQRIARAVMERPSGQRVYEKWIREHGA